MGVKTMKKQFILLGMAAAALLVATSCNPIENKTQSASLLTVLDIEGTDQNGNEAPYLQSDVLTGTGIIADSAIATIRNTLLSPDPVEGTSQYNDVILTRYIVSFTQPNGAGQEGVDVPYSFEGALSTTIPINSDSSFAFIIVREVAKLEPPLVQLQDANDVLECTAKIEFFGHDVANRDVKTTGYLNVFFANYTDASGAPRTRMSIR
jgi:hypothetical protein